MSSSLSDACLVSRAVSPRSTAFNHQHLFQQHLQHQQHQELPLYHHALLDDGGVSSSSLQSALGLGGGPHGLPISSQHSAFNASLRLPLSIDLVASSTYPVRGTPRAFHHEAYPGYTREFHHPLTDVNQPPQTAPQDPSSMRYPHVDLPILNAETYSHGYQFKGPSPRYPEKDSPPTPTPTEDTATSRKRARKNGSVEQDEVEEGKKRARGRPRLNPKDQTAAERRRTQIRLAQRAYRNRKENAITELESQVRDLKEVNDEMRDVVQRLLSSATRQGVAQAPGVGEHLQKLQELVRRSREDGEEENDDDESLPEVEGEKTGRQGPQQQQQQQPSAKVSTSMQGGALVEARRNHHQHQPEQLYGGLIVTHEPVVAQHEAYPSISMQHDDSSGTYQIIAAPTLENASFATTTTATTNPAAAAAAASFLFSSSTNSNDSSNSNSNDSGCSWAFSPWEPLPMPGSLAYQESGFARRLHRYATEKAAYLICLKDPPHERMMRVFGFARLFETTEQIRERTLAVLARTREQSLQNWDYPFYNLGGAGTHFPVRKNDGNGVVVGNGGGIGVGGVGSIGVDGNTDAIPPTRGFRFGPLDQTTSHIRDHLLTISQNIRMPGLQGLFWDCEEVEWYMRQNGVVISDLSADYCTVEVPAAAAGGSGGGGSSFFQYQEVRHREADPGVAASTPASGAGRGSGASVFPAATTTTTTTTGAVPSGIDETGSWTQANVAAVAGSADMLGATQQQPPGSMSTDPGTSMSMGVPPHHNQHRLHNHGQMPGPSPLVGKVVQMNVTKFLDGLTSRAACLGRTPGFRPKDVDAAFWESVMAAQS